MRDANKTGHLDQLVGKFEDRTAVIGVIGFGYV